MITTTLIFLAVLFVLVLVHEWGHYIVAKKTGMRVDEFAIGFPPRLFGYKWGETEYTLNALPLGGFVRIFGESLDHEVEDVSAQDVGRAMWERPKWAQALVLIAGVTMNVLLAFFLFVAVHMIGSPVAVEESKAGPSAQLYITEILPGSPLEDRVKPGAIIVGVTASGEELIDPTPTSFSKFVERHNEGSLQMKVLYGGEESEVAVKPVTGILSEEPERKAVGIAMSLVEIHQENFITALQSAFHSTWQGLVGITVGIYTLIADSLMGQADLSQVAGPIGIAGMVGDAASFGITALLSFVAIISLNLAIVNMLPFPALDGGRLLLVGIEAVTRSPVNAKWAHRLNAAGFALLMAFMLVVTYNDILRIL